MIINYKLPLLAGEFKRVFEVSAHVRSMLKELTVAGVFGLRRADSGGLLSDASLVEGDGLLQSLLFSLGLNQ